MITTLRAALAVVMLLGFYVLAFGIVAGLGVATYLLWQEHAGASVAKLGYLTIGIAVAIVVALWRVARAKAGPESGLPLTPEQAPQLWQAVRELASAAKTRAPDEILLIPVVNAAVAEETKLLGLLSGRRRLYLGIPLLQALSVAQLRAVLAHEMGHYSRQHTRLGEIAYRGREAIVATVVQLSGRMSGWILKQYLKLYLLVEAAVSRRQELEADQLSVRTAGRATAQSALRELPITDAAWGFYQARYIEPGWEAGYAPTAADFFAGFGRMLEARTDELSALRAAGPPTQQSKWDSHPSIAVRVAAMDSMVDTPVSVDSRPAWQLITAFDLACEAVAARSVKFERRTQLPWDQFSGTATLVAEQRQADHIYRAAARHAGVGEGSLNTVLGIVESGRLGEFAGQFFPDATKREATQEFAKIMVLLLRIAAVRSGVATWRHSWIGASTLVGRDGQPLELGELATLTVSPQTLPEARVRIAALGIDLSTAVVVDKVATAHGGDIVDGLANMTVDGVPHDMLILDNGLIFVPCPKKTDGGKARMAALVASAPVTKLASDNVFVPYEEVASATIVKISPIRVELTLRDGRVMRVFETWTGDRMSKNSDDVFKEALTPFLAESATQR